MTDKKNQHPRFELVKGVAQAIPTKGSKKSKLKMPARKTATHRGTLAGLTAEKRKETVLRTLRELEADRNLCVMMMASYAGEPDACLADRLMRSTRDDLYGITKFLGLKRCSSLNKKQLADAISESYAASPDAYRRLLLVCAPDVFETFEKAYAAGGSYAVALEELRSLEVPFRTMFALVAGYVSDGKYTLSITPECMEAVASIGFESIKKDRAVYNTVWGTLINLADAFGFLLLDDARRYIDELLDEPLDELEFISMLQGMKVYRFADFRFVNSGGVLAIESKVIIDGLLAEAFDTFDEELALTREEYKRAQSIFGLPELPWLKPGIDFLDWAHELPETMRLKRFLDEHVPEGQDDIFFADMVATSLIDMRTYFYSPGEVETEMERVLMSLGFTEDKLLNTAIALCGDAIVRLPHWQFGGWTVSDLMDRLDADEVFERFADMPEYDF